MTDENIKSITKKSTTDIETKVYADKRWFSDIGQLVLLVVFIIIWVLDSFVFNFSTLLTNYVALYIRLPIGILFIILGFISAFLGFRTIFMVDRNEPKVIDKSVFGIIRHPTYIGAIFIFFGWMFTTLSLACFGFLLIIMVFYFYIASHEEKVMIQQFGQDYIDYKQRVPKWIPGLKFRKN